MQPIPRPSRAGLAAVASIAALALGLPAAAAPQAVAEQPPPAPKASSKPPQVHQVTLITGDRVTVRDGGRDHPSVDAGPGRRHISFDMYTAGNRLYVVPSDVLPDLTSGRLDRRLFDVTGLIAAGYDDKARTTIPTIVTYTGKAQKRSAPPGAKVSRQLPIVNGTAIAVAKSTAAGFLGGLGRSGIDKVWLDGKRKPSLDVSVPRIGAPAAWQAGFTGRGIKVAVLDSGIDASHPDLATQVAGAKNFTAEAAGDAVGHGTHVASTIAGTGAASDGKYKGVAPDAQLYDGKVCEESGCPDSAVLAGMEWAATEVKAKVVNISLGAEDTPELDPLEAAVNRLTAETGTLFVIAAGNSGPTDRTVNSPGSAEAALTVGATGKYDDGLARFSSRGPRVGDGAVKPDLTAPGQYIVAAKAKNAVIGEPVEDRYLALSGTSMATPHTVGAAVLLAQQHPAWKADELKGALMGSAKPAADQTAFQQGAGRVDVAAAIKQTVVSDPGNLSFGTAAWPHDDDEPVTKELTYRNLGEQPVTLKLVAELQAPDGSPAPADALSLSATTVTVAAGGTASVRATSNTKHSGPDGLYSGRVTATADGVAVTTGIGVDRETERYVLTLRGIGPDGKPAAPRGVVYGIADHQFRFYGDGQPEVQLRLNKAEYIVDNRLVVADPADPAKNSKYWTVQPSLQLTKDTIVVIDARAAKPVEVTVPKPEASLAAATIGFLRSTAAGPELAGFSELPSLDRFYSLQLGPELPADQLESVVTTQWAEKNSAGEFDNSPYLYAQAHRDVGRFPTGFVRHLQPKDLAVIQQQVNAAGERKLWRALSVRLFGYYYWLTGVRYDRPATTTVFVEGGATTWGTEVLEPLDPDGDVLDSPSDWFALLRSPYREYAAGRTYRERFNAAAFGVAPGEPYRYGDQLDVGVFNLVDADGNRGDTLVDTRSSRLLRDGQVIAESPWGWVAVDGLPPESRPYVFEFSQTRESVSGFSTRTDLRWTFSSGVTTDFAPIPALGVGYRPKVDGHNIADRTPVTVLPVFLVGGRTPDNKDRPLPAIKSVQVQVSGDDGKTWQRASVTGAGRGEYKAVFATPKGAKAVSLKTKAVDAAGNVTEQTTIRAYPLR